MKDAPRVARPGDHGGDVLAYKIELRHRGLLPTSDRITNKYGEKMEAAVRAFQEANGLKVTGNVNEATYDALRQGFGDFQRHLVTSYGKRLRSFVLPIVHHEPARAGQFSVGHQDPVRAIFHSTESHDVPHSIADIVGVIEFWKRNPYPSGTLNGAHYLTDAEGFIGQIGTLADILQHTGGANTGSVGVEQVAFARFTPAMWATRPRQLDAAAKIIAYLNHHHGIPITKSTDRGISTHRMQSAIHPESMGHSDPGLGWPMRFIMRRARGYVDAGGWIAAH